MPTPARIAHLDALEAFAARLGGGTPPFAFPTARALGELRAVIASPARDTAVAAMAGHLRSRLTRELLSLN